MITRASVCDHALYPLLQLFTAYWMHSNYSSSDFDLTTLLVQRLLNSP